MDRRRPRRKDIDSHPQLPPVDIYELGLEGVPRDKLEQTVGALHRVNQGLKSSSDHAESALSGMSRMIGRMTRALSDPSNRNHKSLAIGNHNFGVAIRSRKLFPQKSQ